jgi:thioesterase domain-containing protein/acyl carrier protein
MVPSFLTPLDVLPLLPNGKIDRKSLPAPNEEQSELSAAHVEPRTDAERRLAQIWQEVLGLDRIGVHDDFFAVGGHSLLAVRMMVQARAAFGAALPVAAVFLAPTIAELAERIEAERRGEIETGSQEMNLVDELAAGLLQPPSGGGESLVPLRTDGVGTPLFCVHGMGGHVASFLPLAKGLSPARPVYGLQAQGLAANQSPHNRIEAMADFYLREIRQVQPRGPYLLAGWSMGGLIALEVAQRLIAAGDNVDLVAMLDTYISAEEVSPQDMSENSLMCWLAPHLDIPLAELQQLPADQQWEWIARQAKLGNGIGAAEIRRLADVCRAHVAAFEAHAPRVYPGRVLLLRAEASDEPDRRWHALCPRLRVESVAGNHYSMLRKPQVQILTDRLGACLREIPAGGRAAENP